MSCFVALQAEFFKKTNAQYDTWRTLWYDIVYIFNINIIYYKIYVIYIIIFSVLHILVTPQGATRIYYSIYVCRRTTCIYSYDVYVVARQTYIINMCVTLWGATHTHTHTHISPHPRYFFLLPSRFILSSIFTLSFSSCSLLFFIFLI